MDYNRLIHQSIVAAVAGALLLISTINVSALPPIDFSGEITSDYRINSSESDEDSEGNVERSKQMTNTATLNASSYIWRPWFMVVNGSAGITTTDNRLEDQGRSITNFLTGSLNLLAFPQSRFPFLAYYIRDDNDNDLLDDRFEIVTSRYGIKQQYRTLQGNTRLDTKFEQRESESTDQQNLRSRNVVFDFSRSSEKQQLNLSADINWEDGGDENRVSDDLNFTARHHFSGDNNLTTETLLTLIGLDDEFNRVKDTLKSKQLSTFLTWRPESLESLLITSSFRASDVENDASAVDQTDSFGSSTRNITWNTGGYYRLTPALSIRGNIVLTEITNQESDDFNSTQRLGLNYQPNDLVWQKFAYNWSFGGNVANRISDEASDQRVFLNASHGVSRDIGMRNDRTLAFNFTQRFNSSNSTDDEQRQQLNHTASLNFDKEALNRQTHFRLTITDDRTFSDEPSTFQMLNIQYSRAVSVDRNSSWSGDLTLQAIRQKTNTTTVDVLVNGAFVFHRGYMFNIPRLNFQAKLELLSRGLTPDKYSRLESRDHGDEEARFKAEFRYRIGLLRIDLEALITRQQGVLNKSIQVQLNRILGQV